MKIRQSLDIWLRRSYFRAAIIPLLLIELTFLAIYWASGSITYQRNVEAVSSISRSYLTDIANREAATIQATLGSVEGLVQLYALESGTALATPYSPPPAERARYALNRQGVFHTVRGGDQTASFYSGVVPVGPQQIDKVWRTVRLDPTMRRIKQSSPLIRQVYINTWDSYNRIYPYVDVLRQYAPGMHIPSYNFYYEADARHNPARKVVWTDAYVDPAGSGWMVSAIAPVYGPNRLEAVVGIDLTVDTIVDRILTINLPWQGYAMLIGRDGTILALPEAGERDFGLKELRHYRYEQAIHGDTFKPEQFNINKRSELRSLADALRSGKPGLTHVTLAGKDMLASSAVVQGPQWRLVVLAPAKNILADADALRERLRTVGLAMLGILVVFYAAFFVFLRMRARQMSRRVATPLKEVEALMARIGEGEYDQTAPRFGVTEIDTMSERLVAMGGQLGAAYRRIVHQEAEMRRALESERRITSGQRRFINILSHEFRTPLTVIDSCGQILRRRAGRQAQEAVIERADMIRDAAERLDKVMKSALQLVQLEEGKVTPVLAIVPLGALLRDAVTSAGQSRNDVTITVRDDAGDTTLEVDPALMHRALTAIVENAVKYSHENGEVAVTASILENRASIIVTDNGVGIPAADLPLVCERFYRGANSTAVPGAGTGLFLAATLIAAHGGELSIASPPDDGTRVAVILPLASTTAGDVPEAA